MKKYFIFAFIAAALFVSLGLDFDAFANESDSAKPVPKATPKPKISARIENIVLDKKEVLIPCRPLPNIPSYKDSPCFSDDRVVNVKTLVSNPKNVPLFYEYKVSGGRLTGEGANVRWDLSRVRPQIYTITVSIKGKSGVSEETQTQKVTVRECDCPLICNCPTLEVTTTGDRNIRAGETAVFTAQASGLMLVDATYNWTVSQGEIVKGQGTSQIKVRTTPEMKGEITATVEIGSSVLCADCPRTAFLVTLITK